MSAATFTDVVSMTCVVSSRTVAGQARHCLGKLSVNLRVRVGECGTFEAGLPFRSGGEVR